MGDGKKFGVYAFGFIVVALIACFIIGFLIIPTLMPTRSNGGPTGSIPALPLSRSNTWL